jgi:hypothetical protein
MRTEQRPSNRGETWDMKMLFMTWALAVLLICDGARLANATPSQRLGQADAGVLDVSSDPPARIAIDDADMGKVTPQPRLELKAGHHKLTLTTLDGAHTRTIGFTIAAGQTTKLTIHLGS